jgi:hypothetical protein
VNENGVYANVEEQVDRKEFAIVDWSIN